MGFNAIQALSAELGKAEQLKNSIPTSVGIFTIKTANQTISEASLRPNPSALWMSFWYEGDKTYINREQLTNNASMVDIAVIADRTISNMSFHGTGFASLGLLSI